MSDQLLAGPSAQPFDRQALLRACAEIGAFIRRAFEALAATCRRWWRYLSPVLRRLLGVHRRSTARALRRATPTTRAVRVARKNRRRELARYAREARR